MFVTCHLLGWVFHPKGPTVLILTLQEAPVNSLSVFVVTEREGFLRKPRESLASQKSPEDSKAHPLFRAKITRSVRLWVEESAIFPEWGLK